MASKRKSPYPVIVGRYFGLRRLMAGASILIATAGLSASAARAQSCQELWVERNSYYKDAGYCFKTRRAISYFGNRGCSYEYEADVPLSRGIRERIADIRAMEQRRGCD